MLFGRSLWRNEWYWDWNRLWEGLSYRANIILFSTVHFSSTTLHLRQYTALQRNLLQHKAMMLKRNHFQCREMDCIEREKCVFLICFRFRFRMNNQRIPIRQQQRGLERLMVYESQIFPWYPPLNLSVHGCGPCDAFTDFQYEKYFCWKACNSTHQIRTLVRDSVRVKLVFVGRWCGPHSSLPDHVSVLGILYHNFCLPRQLFGSYWNIKMFQMLNHFIADLHHLQKSEAGNSLVYSYSHKIVCSNYLWL